MRSRSRRACATRSSGADLLVLLLRDDALGAQRRRPGLVGDGLLEAGLGLLELRLDHVAAHVEEHLPARHAVAQVAADGHDLTLGLARQIGLLVGAAGCRPRRRFARPTARPPA